MGIPFPETSVVFEKVENRRKVEMNERKFCPLWGNEPRDAVRCLKDLCAFWVDGECAIVKIAKAVSREKEGEN